MFSRLQNIVSASSKRGEGSMVTPNGSGVLTRAHRVWIGEIRESTWHHAHLPHGPFRCLPCWLAPMFCLAHAFHVVSFAVWLAPSSFCCHLSPHWWLLARPSSSAVWIGTFSEPSGDCTLVKLSSDSAELPMHVMPLARTKQQAELGGSQCVTSDSARLWLKSRLSWQNCEDSWF